ncbi:MAG: MlaD family protein [Pseudomonadota bacterium]
MKLSRAQKVRLGAFVITGSVLFVGLGLVLAGLKIWEHRDVYSTRFTESVSGLEVSAPVTYRGLRVGNVREMGIASDDPMAIEVTLALVPGTPLYIGTQAVLDMGGITGLKSINLIPGDPTSGVMEPGTRIEVGPSLVHRLTGQAEQIALKIEMVANELALWTRAENRMRVEKLVDSATQLASDADGFIVQNKETFNRTLEEVGRASAQVTLVAAEAERSLVQVRTEAIAALKEAERTLQEVRRPLSRIDEAEVARVVVTTREAVAKLDQRLSNAELGKAIADLLASLQYMTALIENVDVAVRAGREDFVQSLSNLQDATEDIREFSRIIAQDPSTLIRGTE